MLSDGGVFRSCIAEVTHISQGGLGALLSGGSSSFLLPYNACRVDIIGYFVCTLLCLCGCIKEILPL